MCSTSLVQSGKYGIQHWCRTALKPMQLNPSSFQRRRLPQKSNPPAIILAKAGVAKGSEKKGTTKRTNVHDDGSSPSVMKALATESRRRRGKAFFSSLCLRGSFLSRQRHEDTKFFRGLSELRLAGKKVFLCLFVSLWFKAFMLFATPSSEAVAKPFKQV